MDIQTKLRTNNKYCIVLAKEIAPMKIKMVLLALIVPFFTFAQNWGTVNYPNGGQPPQGGWDVEYIPELHTTVTLANSDAVMISGQTIQSSDPYGEHIWDLKWWNGKLYSATEGGNYFSVYDTANQSWGAVPGQENYFDGRAFGFDTTDGDLWICGEFSDHVLKYDGTNFSTISGLTFPGITEIVQTFSYRGKKYLRFNSFSSESHILVWNDQTATEVTDVPNNYGNMGMFLHDSSLYAVILVPQGRLDIWRLTPDGNWNFVWELPQQAWLSGSIFVEGPYAYILGAGIYRWDIASTTGSFIENPLSNGSSVWYMTHDPVSGYYYITSNYIFWWNGVPTAISDPENNQLFSIYPKIAQHTIWVSGVSGNWKLFDGSATEVREGPRSRETIQIDVSDLPQGMYFFSDGSHREKITILH